MKLADLQGVMVWYQAVAPVNEDIQQGRYPAMITRIYPDGTADLVVFGMFGNGTWLHQNTKFGPARVPSFWSFREMPKGIEELFGPLLKKEEATVNSDDFFAEQKPESKDSDGKTESVSTEPVRKSAVKSSRL